MADGWWQLRTLEGHGQMLSREQIEEQFDSLERHMRELRQAVLGAEGKDGVDHAFGTMQFLRAFYNAPDQRLRREDARRAALAAGLDPGALDGFYAGVPGALRREGDWYVLTPSGKQRYEDNYASLMSRSE